MNHYKVLLERKVLYNFSMLIFLLQEPLQKHYDFFPKSLLVLKIPQKENCLPTASLMGISRKGKSLRQK